MKIWKKLIIPGVVFIVLVAALIIFQAVQSSKVTETSATETTLAADAYFLDKSPTDVDSIFVEAEDNASFSLTADRITASQTGSNAWTYVYSSEDTSKLKLSMNQLDYFVAVMASPAITSTVTKDSADLSEYGLDTPAYVVKYTLAGGETHTLKIGDVTYDDRFVYCMFDETGVVYTTYKIIREKCTLKPIDFMETAVTAVDIEDVVSVNFYRKTDDLNLTAEAQDVIGMNADEMERGWVFTSPFHITSSTAFSNLVKSMLALQVTSFVEQNVTDLAKYELSDPEYRFAFTLTDGQQKEILLSKDMGGIYYGVFSDAKDVFSLTTAAVTGMQTPPIELIKAYTCYEFIREIVKIDLRFPEGSFAMEMDVPEGVKMPEPGATLKLDGKDAKVADSSGRQYYANLFESIATIEISGIDFEAKPVNTKDISIRLDRRDGTSITVDLAIKDENTYYAFIDGKYEGFLVNKDELYMDNGADLYEYGTWPAYLRMVEAMASAQNGVYDIPAT